MDFNKSFLSYDTIEGAKCQTTDKKITQREAAIEAVKKIGLNQISDVKKEWFTKEQEYEMFSKRLEILENSI